MCGPGLTIRTIHYHAQHPPACHLRLVGKLASRHDCDYEEEVELSFLVSVMSVLHN